MGLKASFALALGVAVSGSAPASVLDTNRPGAYPFNDGDVSLWGIHNGAQCTGWCIRTERHQNTIVTYAYGLDGTLMVTDSQDLAKATAVKSTGLIDLILHVPPSDAPAGGTVPPAPVGGNGSVSQSETFHSGGSTWIRTTIFFFINGELVSIEVTLRQFNVER